jgi:hypothetical protein
MYQCFQQILLLANDSLQILLLALIARGIDPQGFELAV